MDEVNRQTPETLYNALQKTVIGQDQYLKDLCTAAWMHNLRYQHFLHRRNNRPSQTKHIMSWPVRIRKDPCCTNDWTAPGSAGNNRRCIRTDRRRLERNECVIYYCAGLADSKK